LVTVDEYLTRERASEDRHEYLDGEIIAMAGESPDHGDISVNLVALIAAQLKGTPCRARTKDTKVRSGPIPMSGRGTRCLFSYPDLVVICGEVEYHDAHGDVILNPTTIIEVLSPSTEAFDRGEKFTRYQTHNPSLTDYLLVSQDRPQVEHFSRHTEDRWWYRRHAGLAAEVAVPNIRCTLRLADVYDRVTFADE
jgi:Uma2 family endonuclease